MIVSQLIEELKKLPSDFVVTIQRPMTGDFMEEELWGADIHVDQANKQVELRA